MNEKERKRHDADPGDTGPAVPIGGGNLGPARQRAEAFFAAADAAIENVLSGDSAKFNQAARQEGGQ